MKLVLSPIVALFVFAGSTISVLAADLASKVSPDHAYPIEVKTVMLNFSDLDLASPPDAQILLKKIHITARKVCKRANPGQRLEDMNDRKICLRDSYKNAVSSVNAKSGIDVVVVAGKIAGEATQGRDFVVTD
ncbi:MAG: UrcA family protein [Pseudomonadota bacterium]